LSRRKRKEMQRLEEEAKIREALRRAECRVRGFL
jgi:hypothetical protein